MSPLDFFGWIFVIPAAFFGGRYVLKRFDLTKLPAGNDHDLDTKGIINALQSLKAQYEDVIDDLRNLEMSKCNMGSLSTMQQAVAEVEASASKLRMTFSTALSSNTGFNSLTGYVVSPQKPRHEEKQQGGNGSATPAKAVVVEPGQNAMAVVGNYATRAAKVTGERVNAREFLGMIPLAFGKPNLVVTAEDFQKMDDAGRNQVVDAVVNYLKYQQQAAK